MNERTVPGPVAAGRLRLGGFVLDLAAGELLSADGQLAGLRKQALQVLLALGRRAGQVVSKGELMDLVWPRSVVGEGSLTQAIAEIRRALADTEHRRVRNVARRGYMLVPDAPGDAPALSIAVLPLAVEGDAAECERFADALHADLIDELSRLQGAMVIGHRTMSTYRDRSLDPRAVAHQLRVRHVVLGRARPEAGAIRLTMALVDGDSGVQRWTDSFVAERAHLPQVLADQAMKIGRALLPELHRSAVEQRATLSPLEISADDLALRAMVAWNRGLHPDNVAEALELLERAVALDRDCARGWAGLSFIHVHAVANGWAADRAAAVRRVCEAASQLERLDDNAFATHQAKVCRAFLLKDWPALLRLTESWVERSHHPNAFGARGMALLLNGRADEAVAALQEALRLDPHVWAEWQYRLAMAHFVAGRYELACDWAQTAALANPALPWPPVHAAAMQRLGRRAEAQQALGEFLARHPGFALERIVERLPGEHPHFVEGRERLVASLQDLGLR
jgi:DNA-binding winged helix-turn-helix (wHTH) protein